MQLLSPTTKNLGAIQPAQQLRGVLARREMIAEHRFDDLMRHDEAIQRMVKRVDLTIDSATGNIYAPGGSLFDLNSEDPIVSLTLINGYNVIFDMIGITANNIESWRQDFISYVAPDGTAAASPTSGVMVDAVTKPETYEYDAVRLQIDGWSKLTRSSKVRDIMEQGMRPTLKEPTWRIDGSMIENDAEWDMVAQASVLLQDFHRLFIIGDSGNANEVNGLQNQVIYGVEDAADSVATPYMDATVIDWQGGSFQASGAGVLLNNVATPDLDGANFIDLVRSFVRNTVTRLGMSPRMNGAPIFVMLMPNSAFDAFLDAYALYIVAGSVEFRKDLEDGIVDALRREREALTRQFLEGTITLNFNGYPVTCVPYDFELRNNTSGNKDVYFLTLGAGSQRFVRLHVKDTRVAVAADRDQYFASDGGRLLYVKHKTWWGFAAASRLDMRPIIAAPWACMRVTDIASNNLLGDLSIDPLSTAHPVVANLP